MTTDRSPTPATVAVTAAPRVLLVEDEPTIVVTLRDDLEEHGYRVTHVGDGAEAVRVLAGGRFDAVITDLRLPAADGMQVLRAARAADAGARILVISASAREREAEVLRAGGSGALQKPFDNRTVLAWLEGALA